MTNNTSIRQFRQLILATVLVAACSGGSDGGKDSVAAASVSTPPRNNAVATVGRPAAQSSRCEHTGLWAPCSIENRLRQAGFVVTRVQGESLERPGFSVKPIVYMLASARLEAFIYSDEGTLARDVAGIDTVTAAPRGTAAKWESTPMFIRSANLAAVLLTENQRQAERVMLALTAGPPQPGSPR